MVSADSRQTMNIYVLSTLNSGEDAIRLLTRGLAIKGVIGLSARDPSDAISGYVYMRDFCREQSLDFIEVQSYTLTRESDRKTLLALDIDVLLVIGWQRLIPPWLISHCRTCAIGSHGSPFGITNGRGRSPQNWALILGLTTFDISIFRIDSNIDSGHIIDSRRFRYSVFDDIRTSYYKSTLLTAAMIVDNIRNGRAVRRDLPPQDTQAAEYLPQRLPEDGSIDWNTPSMAIYNFTRALTRPYPGARTWAGDSEITIYEIKPFDADIEGNHEPGEIVWAFSQNDALVKVLDGFMLITDYEGLPLHTGMKLRSRNFRDQMKAVLDRHRNKRPDLPLAEIFKQFD
jgi:methionyl-tRNA formyltransferase